LKMTNNEYADYVAKKSPPTKSVPNFFRAWLIGGVICCIGQAIAEGYKAFGLDAETAGAAMSVTLIFLGALLTGLGVYDNIAKLGGAGTLVPVTGFANAIVSPALEYKCEGVVYGLSAKIFSISGAVFVFGMSASVIYGLILMLLRII